MRVPRDPVYCTLAMQTGVSPGRRDPEEVNCAKTIFEQFDATGIDQVAHHAAASARYPGRQLSGRPRKLSSLVWFVMRTDRLASARAARVGYTSNPHRTLS